MRVLAELVNIGTAGIHHCLYSRADHAAQRRAPTFSLPARAADSTPRYPLLSITDVFVTDGQLAAAHHLAVHWFRGLFCLRPPS